MSELKPCPFCGERAKWFYSGPTEGGFVVCTMCRASTNIFDTESDEENCKAVAFGSWNRRVEDKHDKS